MTRKRDRCGAVARRKDSNKRRKKSKGSHEMGDIAIRLLDLIVKYRVQASIVILSIITAVAFYIRYLPAMKYGLELDANDPWIAYWIADYFHKNGLLAFDGLRNVKEFWWPYGRNFLSTEYIGVSWVTAATYPFVEHFGLTLKEWLALTPVLAGTITVVLAFILVYKLTGSMLGGLVASLFFAVMPGSIVRTIAGFVEKTGIAIPQLVLFLLFLHLSLESKNKKTAIIYALLAGFFGGSIGWVWGGVHIATMFLSLVIVLIPLTTRNGDYLYTKIQPLIVTSIVYMILTASYPKLGINYYIGGIGDLIFLSLLLYYVALKLYIKGYNIEHYFYVLAVTVLVAGAAVLSGFLPVGGRILAAMGIGKITSPLLTSVQENQGASIRYIVNQYGIALLITIIGFLYQLYLLINKRKIYPVIIALYITSIALFYGNMNLSYLTQMAATFSSITAGVFIGEVMGVGFLSKGGSMGKLSLRKSSKSIDPLPAIIAGTLVVIVLAGSLIQFTDSLRMASLHAPQIDTSGLSPFVVNGSVIVPLNNAWKNALKYINESTPKNSLIVTWWDYGYWVTVNTGRRTLADGATLNSTQIRLLARILTGTEGEASMLLHKIGAKPNETYILAYEVFYFFKNNNTLIVLPAYNMPSSNVEEAIYRQKGYYVISHGQADWAKSFQMLRIGRRVNPDPTLTPYDTNYSSIYNAWKNFPGLVGMPISTVDKVRNTLIYKLMIDGAYSLIDHRYGCNDPLMENITNIQFVVRAMGSSFAGQSFVTIPKPAILQSFVPEKVFVGCPYITSDHTQATGVMIILYKWTG